MFLRGGIAFRNKINKASNIHKSSPFQSFRTKSTASIFTTSQKPATFSVHTQNNNAAALLKVPTYRGPIGQSLLAFKTSSGLLFQALSLLSYFFFGVDDDG